MMYFSRYLKELGQFNPTSSRFLAFYHSKCGVYGYKPELQAASELAVDDETTKHRDENSNLFRFINAYRNHGHKLAELDPLKLMPNRFVPNLQPEQHKLQTDRRYNLKGLLNIGKNEATLDEIVQSLKAIYCGPIGFEFMYVMHDEEREWLTQKIETVLQEELKSEDRIQLAQDMLVSQALDNFLATKLPTVKRYGAEGAESMFGFFNAMFKQSVHNSIEDIQIGMPHRGRINLLLGKLNIPPVILLRMMKGLPADYGKEDAFRCVGDVTSHAYASTDVKINGKTLHVSLLRNPSHLEAVNAVALGKTRGRQQSLQGGDYDPKMNCRIGDKSLCIQVHGDASFAGQGIIMECLAMSAVPHCNVGGSVHLIVNNQLGFTAPSDRSRSSVYCSDVMKMVSAPVIHVNGDHPDAVLKAGIIAFDYREKFRKDILVDLISYRQWGHNELDDPTFTNPHMYQAISARQSVPNNYANKLIEEGIVTKEKLDSIVAKGNKYYDDHLNLVDSYIPQANYLKKQWVGYQRVPQNITTWNTGIDTNLLKFIGMKSVTAPDKFEIHPHLRKTFVSNRFKKLEQGSNIDWATAEALAFGSLLYQGYHVRLCGQDVGRGTFSHRHAMLVDQETNEMYIPLNDLSKDQKGFYEVANSILSEEAVLGFEYGMSIESPTRLNVWEAQFGDFYNGAQIIIDTYVASGDVKWLQQSGLVMLLPHGFDGAGPDHSSSHVERFLQLCDSKEDDVDSNNVNMEIAFPTTPAQYFHLLRRQMIRNYRLPLIIITPKILLRLPAAVSMLQDMAPKTTFSPVFGDPSVHPQAVTKVIFCAGQHYYNLVKRRSILSAMNIAIIRLEALCPFPAQQLQAELEKFPLAKEFVWSQEEPRNMGAWTFISLRFKNVVGCELKYAGRKILGVTAVGLKSLHEAEAEEVMLDTFS